MDDPLRLFTLQLRAQLTGLRQVAVQGRWEGAAPASLPRAVIGTRLLAGSSELLGLAPLHDWLQELLELLNWIVANPDGSFAAYEPVLREIVAFEELLIDRLDAGQDPAELVTPERIVSLQHGFTAASRAFNDARSRGRPVAPRQTPAPADVHLAGLDDLQATISWERFLELAERLVSKVPRPRPGAEDEATRAQRQQRWREFRALADALFDTEDDWLAPESPEAPVSDPGEALPELPGGSPFCEALAEGWREGRRVRGDSVEADLPCLVRWQVPGMTAEGAPPGAPGVDERMPEEQQRRLGRLLGIIATDLCHLTGSGPPRWLLLMDLAMDHITAEFRRSPARLPPETVRALGHLLEEDFLIEAPNLRGALSGLRRESALLHARFGPRGEGGLRLVFPLHRSRQAEVCVVPLTGAEVAAPLHLVEAVVPARGWQTQTGPDGEVLTREGARVLLADLASWVEGLLPGATGEDTEHLALMGLVEKRIALRAAAPARRAVVANCVQTPSGWEPVATGGVELADGSTLPLLDVEKLLALRLRRAEDADGVGGDLAGEWAESPAGSTQRPPSASSLAARGARCRILLLVASPFRAGDLRDKLIAADFDVAAFTEVEPAMAKLREAGTDAIVCDNAEPARCLDALLAGLAADGQRAPGPVILAAGAAGDQARRLAKCLGADGAWTPPYLIEELRLQLPIA